MAELILKIGTIGAWHDGDIIEAFTDHRIAVTHAQHICKPENNNGYKGGLLARSLLEKTYQYRFERDGFAVIRTDLWNNLAEVFTKTPNSEGQYIDVVAFLANQLSYGNHMIFGSPGAEVWYGGPQRWDQIDNIWNDIETHSPNRKADHLLWPLGDQDKKSHLPISVASLTAEQALEMVEELKEGEETIAKRRFKVEWEELPNITEELKVKIKDKTIPVDTRGKPEHLLEQVRNSK